MQLETIGEHPQRAVLSQFLRDELVGNLQQQVLDHLDQCDRCLQRLDELSDAAEPLQRSLMRLKWPTHFQQDAKDTTALPPPDFSKEFKIDFEQCHLGRFLVNDPIAAGGMGVVYRGYDFELRREVAIKVMSPAGNELDQAVAVARFKREAIISGKLQHPGVVPIHKLGKMKNGLLFIAMKLVQGQTLAQWIKGQDRTPAFISRLMEIFGQVCQTVAYAHSHAIIHRDLKPNNIMVGSFGETQVMDWGLAKRVTDTEECNEKRSCSELANLHEDGATLDGAVVGTPAYMAPEQRLGHTVDQRADVFSLGGILCEILTGDAPFSVHRITINETDIRDDLTQATRRLDSSTMDPELIQLAKDCLQFEPKHRPKDAQAVNARLSDYVYRRDELLREAELDRVRSQTRLMLERKRRKHVVILGSVVATFLLCTTVASYYYWSEKNARQQYRYRVERAAIEKREKRESTIRDALQRSRSLYRKALIAEESNQEAAWSQTLMQILKAEGLMIDEFVGNDLQAEFQLLKDEVEFFRTAAENARRQKIRDDELCNVIETSILDSFFQNQGMWYGEQPDFLKRLEEAFEEYGIKTFDDVETIVKRIHDSRISDQLLLGLQHWQSQYFWLVMDREKTRPVRTWFCELLNAADPDPYRIRLRKLLLKRAVPELVEEMNNPQALESMATVNLIMDGSRRCRYEDLPKLLADGFWKKRKEFLSKAYLKFPGEFSINYHLAVHCLGDGTPRRELDLEKAIEHLLICYAMEPECPGVLARLMDGYTRLKNAEQAVIYGDKMVQLFPEMAEVHFVFALHCSLLNLHDQAVTSAKRSIELDSNFVSPYTLLCRIYLERGEFEQAIRFGQAVVEARPENKTAQFWAAEVLRQSKLARNPEIDEESEKQSASSSKRR